LKDGHDDETPDVDRSNDPENWEKLCFRGF
jgi:hypothetical protein